MMTTIQKFEEALTTPDGKLDVLNDSDNVFIMVDEAHRTQYSVLGGLISRALSNVVMISFTGAPIDKGFGRSTMKRFGPLIDSYTIPQSVADGATVPIWYEARLPELHIDGAQHPGQALRRHVRRRAGECAGRDTPPVRKPRDGGRCGGAHPDDCAWTSPSTSGTRYGPTVSRPRWSHPAGPPPCATPSSCGVSG